MRDRYGSGAAKGKGPKGGPSLAQTPMMNVGFPALGEGPLLEQTGTA